MINLLSPFIKFYGYLKKDTMLLYKRKKYLYIFILLPLIIASLFLFALNPSDYKIKVGVCDFDNTQISKQASTNLEGFTTTILPKDNCLENLIDKIQSGDFDLGIEIGDGFSENIENLKQSKLIIYYDNTDIAFSNLVSWKVDQSLEPFEKQIIDKLNQEIKTKISSIRGNVDIILDLDLPNKIENRVNEMDSQLKMLEEMDTEFLVNPLWTDQRGIYDNTKKSAGLTFIFPILALFIILMLASTSIIYDKKTGFITRVKANSSPTIYLLAKVVFFSFLVLIQFLIIFLLFKLYGGEYSFLSKELIKLIFYIGATDALIGLIIGLLSENEGIAVLFSLIISFPLMLVSGLFFPIQTMPKIIQIISKILPMNFQIQASKSILLFNQTISNNWIYGILILGIISYYLIKTKE
jgi:ABC-2 type transport system permease protein